jgi:transposase InsO family protein
MLGMQEISPYFLLSPVAGQLPEDRTSPGAAFEVIGVDFAGPMKFRKSSKAEGKSYLVIFACSLSRAVHLELLRNLETSTFIVSLKRFIARRGRPRVVYSDNGGAFVKASKWLEQLRKDESLRGFTEEYDIKWKFNLSRAPWWGGQFERLIGVVKSAMYKVIGGGHLTWDELSEVLLDVEIQINRRPLSYVEDDIQLPNLTQLRSSIYARSNSLWKNHGESKNEN